MDALLNIDMSDKEEDDLEEEKIAEEPPAEEDYDPRLFDEQKECAQQPVRGNRENQHELTATRANSTQQCK